MDDIVTRLRTPYVQPCICIDVVKAECRSCCDRIDAKREIERLRTQYTEMRRLWIETHNKLGVHERQRELQRAVYTILASDPTPMATLKDILKE